MVQFEKNEIDKEKFKVDIKKITDREKVLNERKSGVMYDDPNRPRTLKEKFVFDYDYDYD
jgi:ribosomal protein S21